MSCDSPRSLAVFEQLTEDLQSLYGVCAERIVCDAHPGYTTHKWAHRQALPVDEVWHHRAHASALAAEPAPLAHNPFSRPPSAVPRDVAPLINEDGTSQQIDLRATMVASNDRLANVAGRTLRPGDEMQGYTLVEVLEDRAIFLRAGKRLTIYVKPDLVEDNEQRSE